LLWSADTSDDRFCGNLSANRMKDTLTQSLIVAFEAEQISSGVEEV